MSPPNNFSELVGVFLDLIQAILPVLVGLTLFVFLWGLAKFIFRVGGTEGEKAVSDGKNLMVWGLVALFVLVSFWAIIAFVYKDIGFNRPFGLPLLPV